MSEIDTTLIKIVIIYVMGAIFETIDIARNLSSYLEALEEFAKENNHKYNRFYIAEMFAGLAVLWPLDIFYTIYFKIKSNKQ
ncbi:MAG: hypothetical protein IJF92_00165 [Bacilli bacterium]|nr:hypothetical protein [Bacilli bacterium]MBQ3307596.1 hypothetical protein [Bacilli bacterium]